MMMDISTFEKIQVANELFNSLVESGKKGFIDAILEIREYNEVGFWGIKNDFGKTTKETVACKLKEELEAMGKSVNDYVLWQEGAVYTYLPKK